MMISSMEKHCCWNVRNYVTDQVVLKHSHVHVRRKSKMRSYPISSITKPPQILEHLQLSVDGAFQDNWHLYVNIMITQHFPTIGIVVFSMLKQAALDRNIGVLHKCKFDVA